MLLWMREGAGAGIIKTILMSLLVLAVAGLVLMDVGGFFRGDMAQGTVVKGKNLSISTIEFDRTVRRALNSQGVGPQDAYRMGLIDNIVQSEIQSRLFSAQANNLGLNIGDETVTKQIAALADQLGGEGQSRKQMLQQILRTQGISESEFVSSIRQEMANNLLRAGLTAPSTLSSPLLAQSLYRYDNEKRGAQAIILRTEEIKDVDAPTAESLQKYYDANKMDFLIPETRSITIATLKPDMLKDKLGITEDDVRAEYEKNIGSYTKPERRTLEQSIFTEKDQAEKILAEIKTGKSLKDVSPSGSYVGEQSYEKTGVSPDVAGPAFDAQKADVVGPVKTALGWQIVIVKDIQTSEPTPFADVKDNLRKEIEQVRFADEMFNLGNTIEDRAAAGESLDTLVAEYGMTTEKIGSFRVNGTDKSGADLFKRFGTDKDNLLQTAFDYDEGEITPIVETADGQFQIIRVDSVTPDSYRSFEDVRASLEKRWMNEQRRLAAQGKAKAIADALNGGKTLDGAAKEHGGTIRTFTNVNRKETPPAPLNPIVAAQIFSTANGKTFTSEIDGGFIVGQVTSITMPEKISGDSKEVKDLSDLVAKSLPQDVFGQYISSLSKDRKIRVNQQQLQQMYGAAPQSGAPETP